MSTRYLRSVDASPRRVTAARRPVAVRVTQLVRRFAGRPVLDSLDLEIHAGEFVALLGASGSGKTTLLRILAGIDAPDDGQAWVPQRRTVVFQEPRLVDSRKVWRNAILGLNGESASRRRALEVLAEVDLEHRADAWPATLSGGEAQRVALARALVRDPQLLLLDEPLAALDALTRLRMQQLIAALWQVRGPATLLVTHDVEEALLLADRVLLLREGRIALDRPIELSRPRHASGALFDELRATLLAELGVVTER
jgi:sulfonate transport system ATP-binding protein